MTALRQALADYLRVRRALGAKLDRAEKLLTQFLAYLEQHNADVVTVEHAVAWATLPGGDGWWHTLRLTAVRRFAVYLRNVDARTQIPPAGLLAHGRENLRMIGRLAGLKIAAARSRAEELLELFELNEAADRVTRTYSGGMRRRLDVAASLVATPRVLFLDEPTTGLDPRGRLGLWQLLGELTAQGTSLLLTTQYLEEADRLADHIVVMDAGRVIATGTAAQLKAQVGGDRLELQVIAGADPAPLAAAMHGLGSSPPVVDAEAGRVVVPVADGPAILPEVAARLAAHDLRVADLAVRRPTLDDVFLTLTGQPTTAPSTTGTELVGRPA